MYIYTSNNKLERANLKNPLSIDDEYWDVQEKLKLGNDNLLIARRKVECLQEL